MSSSKNKKDKSFKVGADASNLEDFSETIEFLWSPKTIPILPHPPSPLEFCRDHVQCSRPCIIRNAILDEQTQSPLILALDDILEILDPYKTILTVDVTPDGHGDCVRTDGSQQELFVTPNECQMSLLEFRTRLRTKEPTRIPDKIDINGRPILESFCLDIATENDLTVNKSLPENSIVYYSRQNDCLRKEISNLQDNFPSGIEWAEEAFGPSQPLDAVNLWMGNELAVSSMHKDHYENLFYVASGEKIFTVCPPADVPFLYEHLEYSTGVFQKDKVSGQWQVARIEEDSQVHWIAPDVTMLQDCDKGLLLKQKYPLLKHVHPVEIRVRAGEMLYLPSLWFHRVTQSCETIGINYWYEMKFDSPLWCYFSFLQQLQHGTGDEAVLALD